jgi:chorismate mutase/prephenate dehydratase
MPTLEELRDRLDALDRTVVETVAERQRVIDAVRALKATDPQLQLRDAAREEAMLARLSALAEQLGLSGGFVRRLFREILDFSQRSQQHHVLDQWNPVLRKGELIVAFQGVPGAYSQMAAEQHFAPFGGKLVTTGYESFFAMLEAVASGAADFGMLPVENTTAGSVNEAYDLLAQTSVSVVGEELLRVQHCLVGLPGAEIDRIKRVFSHPQALSQSSTFLSGLRDCAVQAWSDTAGSVQKVKEDGLQGQAAVASERAAGLYGLAILARNIENQRDNFTRFMVVSRNPLRLDERIACKTSLIFSTRHEQGALVKCLQRLSEANLNLTKLESRPRPGSTFEYLFYVDFEGSLETELVQAALTAMQQHTNYFKILGCYPARAVG